MSEIVVTWASEIQMCNPPTCKACGAVMWWHGSALGFGCPTPGSNPDCQGAAAPDASAGDADALRAAADELDALWRADEARGFRDGFGGAEYQRLSHAGRLRELADKLDPLAVDAAERAAADV